MYQLILLFLLLLPTLAAAAPVASFTARPIQGPTCVAPCAVHFDAIGDGFLNVSDETTDAAYTNEFHSLLFEWDFGDPGGGTWATSGESKNSALGALAGHLYTTAGSYTVTLEVTNPAGETDTASAVVTVTDPASHFSDANTFCFANDDLDWTGCPLDCGTDDNCTDTADLDLAIEGGDNCSGSDDCADADTTKRRIMFRAGDTFTSSIGRIDPVDDSNPGLIEAFGSGTKPIFDLSGGSIFLGDSWTYTGIELRDGSQAILTSTASGGTGADNTTIYDVDVTNYSDDCFWEHHDTGNETTDVGVLHAYIEMDCTAHTTASVQYASWPYSRYFLWMGGTFDRSENNASTSGNYMRQMHAQHWVMQHVAFINPRSDSGGGAVFAHRAWDDWAGVYAHPGGPVSDEDQSNKYHLVTNNSFEITRNLNTVGWNICNDSGCNCVTGSCSAGGMGHVVQVRDLIWERNFFWYQDSGTSTAGATFASVGQDITFRNNVIDFQDGVEGKHLIAARGNTTAQATGNSGSTRHHVYNNTIYFDDTTSTAFNLCNDDGTGSQTGCTGTCECRNNLFVHTGGYTGDSDMTEGSFEAETENLTLSSVPFVSDPIPAVGVSALSDFALAAASSPIDHASAHDFSAETDFWVYDDVFEFCRPASGGDWDMGAHEFGNSLACRYSPGSFPGVTPSGGVTISMTEPTADEGGQSLVGLSFCTLSIDVAGFVTTTNYPATSSTGGGTHTNTINVNCEETISATGNCTDSLGQVSQAAVTVSQTQGMCPRLPPLPPIVDIL